MKPVGKANLLHQQLLGALVVNKAGTLAGHVSNENVDRAATRWAKPLAQAQVISDDQARWMR